jgi:predicted O-methyltransferase YrrM
LSDRVEIIVGSAIDTLPTLGHDHSFDFAFLDADKSSNPTYFKQAQRLVKPGTDRNPEKRYEADVLIGGVVIVDNVVRNARVADVETFKEGDVVDDDGGELTQQKHDAMDVEGVRRLLREVGQDPTVEATTIATVGEKGYDGFMYAIVNINRRFKACL